MADDDIETIECSDNDSNGPPDKPLMQLFSRLIGSDNKQNTVLTNAQIVEILQYEFNIDILDLHELEVEIYLNIMKKFLKDWPQWDELDNIIKQKQGNQKSIQNIIQNKYNKLKDYLKVMLDTSMPMAKEAVENAKTQTAGIIQEVPIDTSDIVMKINSSRPQINHLIFQQPQPTLNNSIFNIETAPSRIIVNPLSLTSIVNWWDVSVTVNLKGLQYERDPTHQLKHVLINKKLKEEISDSNKLDQDLEIYTIPKKSFVYYKKSAVINYLKIAHDLIKQNSHNYNIEDCEAIFEVIENDLKHFTDVIRFPGQYRRFANQYKYVRYLYKETPVQSTSRNYDLQLKETLSPQISYNIPNFDPSKVELPNNDSWIEIWCLTCTEKFTASSIGLMKQHFMMHQSEPDWKCTNCNKTFAMSVLASQSWEHQCES